MRKLAILLLTCSLLAGACRGNPVTPQHLSGVVRDAATQQPLSGATITAYQVGPGVRDGRSVIDAQYVAEATSDSDGRFMLQPKLDTAALVRAAGAGYLNAEGWYQPGDQVTLLLDRPRAATPNVVRGFLQIGFRVGVPYGWSFARQSTTEDASEADVFPLAAGSEPGQQLILRTPEGGGIAIQPAAESNSPRELFLRSDAAPTSGYVPTTTLQLAATAKANGALYFVRTGDGMHYAKVVHDPAAIAPIGTETEAQQGTWGLLLEYAYNPEASHDLVINP